MRIPVWFLILSQLGTSSSPATEMRSSTSFRALCSLLLSENSSLQKITHSFWLEARELEREWKRLGREEGIWNQEGSTSRPEVTWSLFSYSYLSFPTINIWNIPSQPVFVLWLYHFVLLFHSVCLSLFVFLSHTFAWHSSFHIYVSDVLFDESLKSVWERPLNEATDVIALTNKNVTFLSFSLSLLDTVPSLLNLGSFITIQFIGLHVDEKSLDITLSVLHVEMEREWVRIGGRGETER